VYVDNEPIAVAHSEIVLDGNDGAAMERAGSRWWRAGTDAVALGVRLFSRHT
jgi:hypothetical protein